MEWQSQYVDELEKTKVAINIANQLIEKHETSVNEIYKKLQTIPEVLKPIEQVLITINSERESTQATLVSLAKLGSEAENSIPVLENKLKELSNTLSYEITAVSSKMIKLDEKMSKELEKAIEMMGAHLGSLSEQLVNDYRPLVSDLRKLIELSNRVKK